MFDLKTELKTYKPYDLKEAEAVKQVLDFLDNSTNCYDRSNLKGHVTAGGFVADGKGNILLNHHKKTGMWFQFGGHSDGESDCLNVAKREIFEETGIDKLVLVSDKIYDVAVNNIDYSVKKNEPAHLHYDINFLFYVKNKKFKISNESTDIKWVTIPEARKLVNKDDYSILRMIDKYEHICNKK